jgi:DNA-binding SARP family transcriptional activator
MSRTSGCHAELVRPHPSYAARQDEEEAKLRWLIARHPGSLELAYYLIFLLAANERYEKALEECRRVLSVHPEDLIVRVWREFIGLRQPRRTCR